MADPSRSVPESYRLRSAGILVVEDDPDHLDIVCDILEQEGCSVEGASNGKVALDRLLGGVSPDLIVTDLVMPVMDGWQLIGELKARPGLAVIPVIVISGAGQRVLSSAPVSAGYLAKPVHRERLLETLEICLERRGPRPPGVSTEGE